MIRFWVCIKGRVYGFVDFIILVWLIRRLELLFIEIGKILEGRLRVRFWLVGL